MVVLGTFEEHLINIGRYTTLAKVSIDRYVLIIMQWVCMDILEDKTVIIALFLTGDTMTLAPITKIIRTLAIFISAQVYSGIALTKGYTYV
ncbi:MAG: hypothetical protein DYG84_15250 [Candidatus Brocadia sp. AMX3]|nr:hypothetical protein [Candidatus Brocadia sp. AMX3]